ncbi:protein N-lysine methyltransferase METTL21D-like [Watersipora subatra]|uniref:protein N-lysine methyltransferase METTL21D-like n=1 Tax=Watersipora subatra TaxID=2589382 RepID=UPI00355C7913
MSKESVEVKEPSFQVDRLYTRVTQLDDGRSISIYQSEVGDVGCVVWDAAIVLAKFYEHIISYGSRQAKTSDQSVNSADVKAIQAVELLYEKIQSNRAIQAIELGSGTGYVGIIAAALGAQVTVTDLPEFVELMKHNVRKNNALILERNGRCDVSALVWGTQAKMKTDLILLSDCIYYEQALTPLVNSMVDLSKPDTIILCCHEERTTDNKPALQKQFFKEVAEHFSIVSVPVHLQHPTFSSEDIHINILLPKLEEVGHP